MKGQKTLISCSGIFGCIGGLEPWRASVCPNAYCQTYFTMHTADVFGRKRNVTYVLEKWISPQIVGQVSMFINYYP